MASARDLFDGHPGWLAHTLALGSGETTPAALALASGGRLKRIATGILQVEPTGPTPGAPTLILSAGIHGNETAPIELLDQLVDELIGGQWEPRISVLLILGNPPAMVSAQRFSQTNLNRLFCGAHQNHQACYETRRAGELERTCRAFSRRCSGPIRHYDLHTAIRPSKREKFALYPFVEGRCVAQSELFFLAEAEIGTLLLQHRKATTFSSFSATELGAESFTLELGKVHPFGSNDLSSLSGLKHALTRLISGREPPAVPVKNLPEPFEVVHEILNTGEHFRFHVNDGVANFTEYPPDTRIWEDKAESYHVGPRPEAIVFPNPQVPVGQRVGLMIRRVPRG